MSGRALGWVVTGLAVAASVSLPAVTRGAPTARVATTGCPQTIVLRGDTRVVNLRVSRVSCAVAARVVRRFLRPGSREGQRIGRQLQRSGYADFLGYRFRPLARSSWHARRPGRNIYFTIKRPPPPPRADFDELLRVIVLNRDIDRRARVVSADLYSDGVIVRYFVRGPIQIPPFPKPGERPTAPQEPRPGPPDIELQDDVGTRYQSTGAGSSYSPESLSGETSFAPGVPTNATRLTLRIRNRAPIEIPVATGPVIATARVKLRS